MDSAHETRNLTFEEPSGINPPDDGGTVCPSEIPSTGPEDKTEPQPQQHGSDSENLKDSLGSTTTVNANEASGPVAGQVGRDLNYVFNTVVGQAGDIRKAREAEEPWPLIELTFELPLKPDRAAESPLDHLTDLRLVLEQERLLMISCADEQIAWAVIYGIIEKLELPDEQRRALFFNSLIASRPYPTLGYLRRTSEGAKATVVVVDTVSAKAREFLDSLLEYGIGQSDLLKKQLETHEMLMLFLVDSNDLQSRNTDHESQRRMLPFEHREIPFLQPLLEAHFPANWRDIEQRLLSQRSRGWWNPDDRLLALELRKLVRAKKLETTLSERESAQSVPVSSLLSSDDAIQDTILYVAAFFAGLTPREFQSVVAQLLGEQTITVSVPTAKKNQAGETETVEVRQEKPLIDLWRASMDKRMTQCHLVTVSSFDSGRTVNFENYTMGNEAKAFFEEARALFVSTQFERLMELGLLFDNSPRISENMVRLSAATIAGDPDYYCKAWLFGTIEQLEKMLADEELDPNGIPEIFQALNGLDDSRIRTHVYQRIAEVLRLLSEEYRLKTIVADLLNHLLSQRLYGSVLQLTRRLRFVANFDEFYWLKQLFERGDAPAALMTFVYLYGQLKSLGTRIYECLRPMDSWLSEKRTQTCSFAPSGGAALRLFMSYSAETTARLAPRHYGEWPSRHPLFAFRDLESAKDNLCLLARWLFHPWMKIVFSEPNQSAGINDLNATLIFHWVIILIGPSGSLPTPQLRDSDVTAGEVQHILINQIIAATNADQQSQLLTSWDGMSRDIVEQIKELPYSHEGREQLIWQRNLLDDLIVEFRALAL